MQIKVNGEKHVLPAPVSVAALAAQLGLKAGQAAIERNREIVPKSRWGETNLNEGDEIEIVKFIGGG